MTKKLKVLFLCTGNSCRSQMAEGWADHLKSDVIDAFSAGTMPTRISRRTIAVMKEVGVDISDNYSKPIDDVIGIEFDYVVTLCDNARESCPIFPSKAKVLHVGFEDPHVLEQDAKTEEGAMTHYRRVRDEIKKFVKQLPEFLEKNQNE